MNHGAEYHIVIYILTLSKLFCNPMFVHLCNFGSSPIVVTTQCFSQFPTYHAHNQLHWLQNISHFLWLPSVYMVYELGLDLL